MEGKKFKAVSFVIAMVLAVFAAVIDPVRAAETAPIRVVATLYPQWDFARQIAGDRAQVSLLLPPGMDSHSFEPTPGDMKAIAAADLFIYTGPHMEPWAARLAESAGRPAGVRIVDASAGIGLKPGRDHQHAGDEHAGHDDHDHASDAQHDHEESHDTGVHAHVFDPHIWTDPVLAAAMVDSIAGALMERDPDHADGYRAAAAALREDLLALDRDFQAVVAASQRRTLVFGERFAFAYFFSRYGLTEVGAYASCAPGVEPGVRAVLGVVKYVRDHGIRYIYRDVDAANRISNVIQEETGAEILIVDSLHNPPEERLRGKTFQSLMRENMAAFARGLE